MRFTYFFFLRHRKYKTHLCFSISCCGSSQFSVCWITIEVNSLEMIGGMLLAVKKVLRYCALFYVMWDDLVLSLTYSFSPFLVSCFSIHQDQRGRTCDHRKQFFQERALWKRGLTPANLPLLLSLMNTNFSSPIYSVSTYVSTLPSDHLKYLFTHYGQMGRRVILSSLSWSIKKDFW